jgi:hypothetical protein
MLESITAALKRLSVIHKIACIATNHMYAEMSCSCLPTHRSFSAQCVILQIFALYSGLVSAGASVMLRIEERGVVEFSAGMH